MCQGIYRNAVPRFDFSELPSYNFEDKFLLHEKEDPRSKTSWRSGVSVLNSSAVLFPIPLSAPQSCLYQWASICKKPMPDSLNFRRVLTMVHFEQVDRHKSVLMYPVSSVYQLQASVAADHSSETRNTHGLTGNVGYSRAARSFRIMEFLCISQGIRLVLHFLYLNHKLLHRRLTFFLLRRKILTPQLSSSFSLCTANSS